MTPTCRGICSASSAAAAAPRTPGRARRRRPAHPIRHGVRPTRHRRSGVHRVAPGRRSYLAGRLTRADRYPSTRTTAVDAPARRRRATSSAEVKPQAARLAARRHLPARRWPPASCWSSSPPAPRRPGRRRRSSPRPRSLLFGASARSTTAAPGRPRDRGVPPAARPLEHLPAHRRHLHAVHAAPARRHATARRCCCDRLGRRRCWASRSGCSGSARRAGSTRRSTSRSAGRRSFFLPATSAGAGGAAVRHADRRRRRCSTRVGGVVYGLKRPEPVAALVRLPRGVPRAHARGVRRALRRRLAGDLLPALTGTRVSRRRPAPALRRHRPRLGRPQAHRPRGPRRRRPPACTSSARAHRRRDRGRAGAVRRRRLPGRRSTPRWWSPTPPATGRPRRR